MRPILFAALVALTVISMPVNASCTAALNATVDKLHSQQQLDLCALTEGKTTLVVNTASRCGFTPQFDGLEALYQTYQDKPFTVIGFPSNDFNQELDDEADTAAVCYVNYGVSFPMAATSAVTGNRANPIFQFLNKATQEPGWNFNKYLISKEGKRVSHFPATARPRGGELEAAIRGELGMPTR